MKRRQQPLDAEPPPELIDFDPDAWPQGGLNAWSAARRAWAGEHGWQAFGGLIPALSAVVQAKHSMLGLPPPPPLPGLSRRVRRPTRD
jgi:hypothetical protein